MDKRTCDRTAVVVLPSDAANARAQSLLLVTTEPAATDQEQHEEEAWTTNDLGRLILHALAFALVTYSFALAAWRARRDPRDASFVAGAYAALSALLLCLRRAEQLVTPDSDDSPPAAAKERERERERERRRLHVAVWALSTALSCAFAYRVSRLMPPALVVVVWCMTSVVAAMGFCLLVLCKDQQQQYQSVSVDDVDCDSAADDDGGKEPLVNKIIRSNNNTDEIV